MTARPVVLRQKFQSRSRSISFWAVYRGSARSIEFAVGWVMRVDHFSKLICWQLARELQREVFRITSKPGFNRNFELRDQLRDAASSARRNIAEGFGRRTHRDFANFLSVSLTSANEVEDELGEAVDDGCVTSDDIAVALNLCKRTVVATSRFRKSLVTRPRPVVESLATPPGSPGKMTLEPDAHIAP